MEKEINNNKNLKESKKIKLEKEIRENLDYHK
jgi:hypothetical protein